MFYQIAAFTNGAGRRTYAENVWRGVRRISETYKEIFGEKIGWRSDEIGLTKPLRGDILMKN